MVLCHLLYAIHGGDPHPLLHHLLRALLCSVGLRQHAAAPLHSCLWPLLLSLLEGARLVLTSPTNVSNSFFQLGDPFPILSPRHGILSIEQVDPSSHPNPIETNPV